MVVCFFVTSLALKSRFLVERFQSTITLPSAFDNPPDEPNK